MSNLGGRLWEVVVCESLDHIGSKFRPISIWQLERLTPFFNCFIHVKSQIREKKNPILPIEKFPSHLIIQFSLYYLSSGRLQEVKTKENFEL